MHLSGVVLPEGEHRDLYVVDGLITYEKPACASRFETVARSGFVVPGLVDAHCHVGLDADGAVPAETQREQAEADRDAGALLLRDAGSAADTRWIDEETDLPRLIRAGRHIARPKRYLRNYGVEIEPAGLVAAVSEQARRGDGWVKLVGDWIDRGRGDLAPLWPAEVLPPAIEAAHALGARVTAHVFGAEGIPDLLDAGIDCLEHATGLTDDMIARMAENGTALVPTRLQMDNFPSYAEAGEAKFPAYAAHIRSLYAGVDAMTRSAYEAGVPIYAGSDAGGVLSHGLIGQEIRLLSEKSGLSAYDALAGGSWAAREWLGKNAVLSEGAPADLVVYDTNPLDDLSVLMSPVLVMLRGHIVLP